jgi:transcriptional regulator with XRE-family HTH domain
MELFQRIKSIRSSKGISQAEMAEKLDIAVNNYSKIERGVTELSVNRTKQIADALGVSLAEILGLEVQSKEDSKVTQLEERIKELEDRIKDKEYLKSSIESDCFGMYVLLRHLELSWANEMGFEIIYDEEVYMDGKLEEYAVDIYIKNEKDRKEVFKKHFLTNLVITEFLRFSSLNFIEPKSDEFKFWRMCLQEFNPIKRYRGENGKLVEIDIFGNIKSND